MALGLGQRSDEGGSLLMEETFFVGMAFAEGFVNLSGE
jgi:hypothetical protein